MTEFVASQYKYVAVFEKSTLEKHEKSREYRMVTNNYGLQWSHTHILNEELFAESALTKQYA